jgi:radical SAM protein with 4Fe4S-binding SPASM domain
MYQVKYTESEKESNSQTDFASPLLSESRQSYHFPRSSRRPPAKPVSPFLPKNFRQFSNLIKISSSLGWSLLTRKAFIWGNPIIVHIEPTSLCNLHCPLCPSGNGQLSRQRTSLDYDQFKTIINKLPQTVRMILLWNQGEPFLVRDLVKMIEYAKQQGKYVVTSTNGHFFKNSDTAHQVITSGIDEIIISLDGVDQESYAKYRIGGKIDRVFEGVKQLAETKEMLGVSQPCLHLQFILMKHNLSQKNRMIEIGKEIGADKLSFKTLQVTNWEAGAEFLPDDPEFTRYEKKHPNGAYTTRKRKFFPNDCLRLWYSLVLNCDGDVSPCCFDKDSEFKLGNILEEPFESIWQGESYQKFRQKILDSRYELEMCRDCTEGLQNLFTSTINYHDKSPNS